MNEKKEWNKATIELYSSGLISSEERNKEIINEIKKRFIIKNKKIPNLPLIIELSKSNINSISKAEIYFVYLYYSDVLFANILDSVIDVYDHQISNPIISRDDIKNLLENILTRMGKKESEKTRRNWIGKFLSTLKESNILISKENHHYIMNFGGLTIETWSFFILHSYFNNYNPMEGLFVKPLHILPGNVPNIIKRAKSKNWVYYKITELINNFINFKIETKCKDISHWLSKL